jgi:hypothetical protein
MATQDFKGNINGLSLVSSATKNAKLYMNDALTDLEWSTGVKVGTFQRALATAAGTQEITTVGFMPSSMIFIGVITATPVFRFSIGFDDNVTAYCLASIKAAELYLYSTPNYSIYAGISGTDDVKARLTAVNHDGFTLSWSNTGTGTLDIYYIAFR